MTVPPEPRRSCGGALVTLVVAGAVIVGTVLVSPDLRLTDLRDAAIDPLSDPAVRQAVLSATFEALVGFQLTDAQLRYNVTR